MYKLFLDDLRTAPDSTWVVCRTADEFTDTIGTHKLPHVISFDHDLGLDYDCNNAEKNGYWCVNWLIDYCMDNNLVLPIIKVHSQNPIGKANIISYVNNFLKSQN